MGAAPWYTTREAVKSDLDIAETARANALVDRCIRSASRSIEGLLHYVLYPHFATRRFDWPNTSRARSGRLWLDEHLLISLSELTSGGETIPLADAILYPDDGPPYDRIELDEDSDSTWTTDGTRQNSIVATGLWGDSDVQLPAGALNGAIASTSVTSITVDATSAISVGNLIKIGSERMVVTDRQLSSTGETLTSGLDADMSDQILTGHDPVFVVGDVILVDAEKMRIDELAGTSLIVTRAWDGSTLAAHSIGATVYAYRTLTVERGSVGSTAATHLDNATITVWEVPAPIEELAAAWALDAVLQKGSGYARRVGSGDNEREASGKALREVRARAMATYGRRQS